MSIRITGLTTVVRNLNSEVRQIRRTKTRSALRVVALIVQHDSQELTPVDTGNLKGSAYTNPPIVDAKGKDGEVEVGYTAEYAAFVHEQDKNYNTGQWKFLETALNNNKTRILKILRGELKI